MSEYDFSINETLEKDDVIHMICGLPNISELPGLLESINAKGIAVYYDQTGRTDIDRNKLANGFTITQLFAIYQTMKKMAKKNNFFYSCNY